MRAATLIRRAAAALVVLAAAAWGAWVCVGCAPSSPGTPGGDAASDAPSDAACPNDLPASCPTPIPSYASDVEPLLARHCYACHTDGGVSAAAFDFSTYDKVFAQRSAILNQVYACSMPPADGGVPLDPAERAALLGWLVCHAPKN